MGRRTLLLITSILIAAVGTALIGLYVRGANDRAIDANSLRKVLVAQTEIPSGSTLSQGSFKLDYRRVDDLPPGFLDDAGQVTGRTTSVIHDGQILQKLMFTSSDSATVTGGIDAGKEGITIELQDPERAAGLLKVGSKINIYAIISKKVEESPVVSDTTVIMIGDQHVDSSDDTATDTNTESVPGTLVGLALTRPEIDALKNAETAGKLFFSVLPGKDK